MAAHGRAVLAISGDEDDAESWFEQALALHADSVRPFERARTQLAYGEHLRRQRRRVDARAHLRAALETFEDLKAGPWADRAAQELRASGETARKRDEERRSSSPRPSCRSRSWCSRACPTVTSPPSCS